MSDRIPYEDVQAPALDLVQCATNILSVRNISYKNTILCFNGSLKAVNGPLQERTTVLNLDYSRSNAFPADYDTDIESDWSNLSKRSNIDQI